MALSFISRHMTLFLLLSPLAPALTDRIMMEELVISLSHAFPRHFFILKSWQRLYVRERDVTPSPSLMLALELAKA